MKIFKRTLATAALVSIAGGIALGLAAPASAIRCIDGYVPKPDSTGTSICVSAVTGEPPVKGTGAADGSGGVAVDKGNQPVQNGSTKPVRPAREGLEITPPATESIPTNPTPLFPEDPRVTANRNLEARALEAVTAPKESEARLPSEVKALEDERTAANVKNIALIAALIVAIAVGLFFVVKSLLPKLKTSKEARVNREVNVAKENSVASENIEKTTLQTEDESIVSTEPEESARPLTRRDLKERNNTPG